MSRRSVSILSALIVLVAPIIAACSPPAQGAVGHVVSTPAPTDKIVEVIAKERRCIQYLSHRTGEIRLSYGT